MERFNFLNRHKKEPDSLISPEKGETLETVSPERLETHVLRWEKHGVDNGKDILLEAAEPIAHDTIKPLVASLEEDERTKSLTLITDNVAGRKFTEENEELQLTQIRDENLPVLAEIPNDIDAALVVIEPANSPDKPLLYSAKSVFGDSDTKLFYYIEGLPGHNTRELFTSDNASRMDDIDTLFVGSKTAKEIVAASLPKFKGRIEVIDSLLLPSKKEMFPKPETRQEERLKMLEHLGIPKEAVVVFYSGFPSSDYEEIAEGETLNQKTFNKSLNAIASVAEQSDDKQFALIVREHPRAKNDDDQITLPASTPDNLTVVTGEGSDITYDDVANSSDFIICQSTSSEVTLSKYRGVRTLVSGYKGMQEELNEQIFGEKGLEKLKSSSEVIYINSEADIMKALKDFKGDNEMVSVSESGLETIKNKLLE